MSQKMVWTLFWPLTWKIIKIFHFGLMVWAWWDRHFDHVTVHKETLITEVNIAQYAPNFTCLSDVIQIYVFHRYHNLAGPNGSLASPKLQPQGSLSCAWMKIGGHMYHTQIYKKVSAHHRINLTGSQPFWIEQPFLAIYTLCTLMNSS